jgi:GNAT superfamily N-acetyltransferase
VSEGQPQVRVERVEAAAGRSLRMAVLRSHEPPDRPMYPLEDDPATLHFAALLAQRVVSVGSAMAESHPRDPRSNDWRIRGMATEPDARGRGLGSSVLDALEAAARERGARRLWCNARVGARAFYEHARFRIEGEEYEIAAIGPHFLMSKTLG